MLPLSLLNTAKGHPILVELKTGVTYNGHLHSCDNWMNINLHEVICTAAEGDKFWRLQEVYIRGNTIKYLRLPDEIIDIVREDREFRERREAMSGNSGAGRGRGGYNNRGGGGGQRGGRGGFAGQRGGKK
ncbi:Sm-like ribonucleo protein [Rhizoclosmatium globosum]|uniref:LSM complex subunit LSM4 n=1 Tax=Rhizoclosmatium globosum TaxID=329046 RepID=A0A1Y2BUS0_9FUNG|nr:RNA processing protein [Rhizoclosmatium sp. JEL0117]ORY38387.1 Sm-like ribonucleo protein [Rhizoclosmatium globosum]|eukprot:ORY38387.1 Sm-like ribonucleo protein [Rhizoclosmatium globosum]